MEVFDQNLANEFRIREIENRISQLIDTETLAVTDTEISLPFEPLFHMSTGNVTIGVNKAYGQRFLDLDLYGRNGKCFGVYELGKPVLYLSDPELIREVLVKDFHMFTNKKLNMISSDHIGTQTVPDGMII
ncbi:unnamed protein product [Oppiella nova]|uniref:Uncharacterized protein n=1 Tax=Oppiella nova TaxID=334625 RepID=A0A7R9M4H4_9ACAR|nr:unnamed protein product [Oppiella nova]CAG2170594.1 unnamed protein product [Oppiella nova]